MPYLSADTVAQKRKEIRKALPEYKLSVTRNSGHSGIDISILAGPIDFGTQYTQVNPYYFKEHYAEQPQLLQVLETIHTIASAGEGTGYFDQDYGHIPSFYVNMNIGNWDKPYQIVK